MAEAGHLENGRKCEPSQKHKHSSGSSDLRRVNTATILARRAGNRVSVTLLALLLDSVQARHSFCTADHNLVTPNEEPLYGFETSVVIAYGTQVVLINGTAYGSTQLRACNLVGSEMYPAVDARVGDVVGNLSNRCVLQDDTGYCRIR